MFKVNLEQILGSIKSGEYVIVSIDFGDPAIGIDILYKFEHEPGLYCIDGLLL